MRKHLFLVLAVAMFVVGCGASNPVTVTPPVNKDWTVTVQFNYDFTNYAPCSASVTKGCITGFTWGYMQGTNQIPLQTMPVTGCTGAANPKTCTATTNALLGIGTVTPYAVANGIDNNGTVTNSASVLGTPDNVQIGNVTNVSWSRQ